MAEVYIYYIVNYLVRTWRKAPMYYSERDSTKDGDGRI